MKVDMSQVTKIRITGIEDLDAICVYFEDFGPGRGKIIIECFGDSWANGWGAMGENYNIRKFFLKASNDYLINKLSPSTDEMVTDYSRLDEWLKAGVIELRKDCEIAKDDARELWNEREQSQMQKEVELMRKKLANAEEMLSNMQKRKLMYDAARQAYLVK